MSESFAVFDNLVPAYGHPFPVDECPNSGNIWATNIARSDLNPQPKGVVQRLASGENGGHMFFDQEKFCSCVLGHHPVEAQQ